MNALAADWNNGFRTVNTSFAGALPADQGQRLRALLADHKQILLEPLQQLLVLRRALTVSTDEATVPLESDKGMALYFDACRFAADIIPAPKEPNETESKQKAIEWLKVASGMMNWFWVSKPFHPTQWIGRSIEMFEELPKRSPTVAEPASKLKALGGHLKTGH